MNRVLLVYANPAVTATPVPPLGMERVGQVLALAGCDVRLAAPFLEADPLSAFEAELSDGADLVGFSIRNVDDALVVRSEEGEGPFDLTFYLDAIRPLVAAAVAAVGTERVVLGGTGLSCGPKPILRYLGATRGIRGPADDLVWHLGRALVRGDGPILPDDPRVVVAGTEDPPEDPPHRTTLGPLGTIELLPAPARRMGPYLGLTVERNGRVPIAIDAGCDRRCQFCVEGRLVGGRVLSRSVDAIEAEARQLANVGVRRVWLATSELNVPDEKHGIAVLRRLAPLGLELSVFLQPAPVTDDLLDAIEDAGIDPNTLSFELGHLDPGLLRAGAGPANAVHVERLVETWVRRGYRTLGGSVLFGAHPNETWETLDNALRIALRYDAALPDGLGLAYATGARVYPETGLADWIGANRAAAAPDLYGDDDPSFVRPVVFARPASPRALLRYVRQGLAGAKGRMGPMNAEAPADPRALEVEALVNRGIVRRYEDRPGEAAACFEQALALDADHLEALAQVAQVRANDLGDALGARAALGRLLSLLKAGDPRAASVEIALNQLPEA